jgi:hypothetical protein
MLARTPAAHGDTVIAAATALAPVPTHVSKDRIHAFAEHIADQLKIFIGDLLETHVARLGGRMAYHDSPGPGREPPPSIFVRGLRDFTIYVPTMTSATRDRFSIAHELGHLFLHFPMVQKASPGSAMRATRWVDRNDPEQQRAEWEANWFAAAFLMPAAQFREVCGTRASLSEIAKRCGVSEQAAQYRMQALDIVRL